MSDDDFMKQEWCCLVCSTRFPFGKLRTRPASPHLHCPNCGATNTHPADGTEHDLPDYHGEKGPIQ